MLVDAYRWLVHPYRLLDSKMAREGLTFRIRLPLLGNSLVTGDPEIVREIQNNPMLDAGRGISALRAVLGDRSLITLDGKAHKARKHLMAPPLRDKRIRQYDDLTNRLARESINALPTGEEFSAYTLTRHINLRTILTVIFGDKSTHELEMMETLVTTFLQSFSNPLVLYLSPLQVDLGRFSSWGRALRNRRRLEQVIEAEIVARRETGSCGEDVLSQIVREANDNEPDELTTEVLTLLMFGHDTGAATLAWVFEHLYRSPGALRRASDEARLLEARDIAPDASNSPFLVACLKESMRLAPVVVHLTRVAARGFGLAGHSLVPGDRVLPSAYVAQHNSEVFPEPDQFLPERFLDGEISPHAYFPFGLGVRTCIGELLVFRGMLQILSSFLAAGSCALVSSKRARPVRNLALIVPEGGTRMRRCA